MKRTDLAEEPARILTQRLGLDTVASHTAGSVVQAAARDDASNIKRASNIKPVPLIVFHYKGCGLSVAQAAARDEAREHLEGRRRPEGRRHVPRALDRGVGEVVRVLGDVAEHRGLAGAVGLRPRPPGTAQARGARAYYGRRHLASRYGGFPPVLGASVYILI